MTTGRSPTRPTGALNAARRPEGNGERLMPERIQLRRTKGWRLPAGARSVARPTRWGNPFRVGGNVKIVTRQVGGLAPETILYERIFEPGSYGWFDVVVVDAELAVRAYRQWIDRESVDASELAGLDLACWCPLDGPCHADVLLDLANPTNRNGETR